MAFVGAFVGSVHTFVVYSVLGPFVSRVSYLEFLTKRVGPLMIPKILNWYIVGQ
jgi:hypothetical protein